MQFVLNALKDQQDTNRDYCDKVQMVVGGGGVISHTIDFSGTCGLPTLSESCHTAKEKTVCNSLREEFLFSKDISLSLPNSRNSEF